MKLGLSVSSSHLAQAAEASGTDAFLLKKTLGTLLLPTIQGLRGSLAPPQASQDSA